MMRCKVGTSRRSAITFSSTEEYVEVRVNSIIELLRFTGVALAAIRMGLSSRGEQESAERGVPPEEATEHGAADTGSSTEETAGAEDGGEDVEKEGFERSIYLSYRSFRIKVA